MDFELQPILKGDLLELRPLKAIDYEDLYNVASDPLIWEQHPEKDRYKRDIFDKFFKGAMDSGGALLALDTSNQQVIGTSRYILQPFTKISSKDEVEIGWTFLARRCWGGAYNKEMKVLMLKHAFKFVDSVLLIVGPENFRSQKAAEKIGGTFIGVRQNPAGQERFVYQITADKFACVLSGP